MDITLHILNGYLLASKAYLNAHLKEIAEFERQNPTISNLGLSSQLDPPDVTREELKNALVAAQVHFTSFVILFLTKHSHKVFDPSSVFTQAAL